VSNQPQCNDTVHVIGNLSKLSFVWPTDASIIIILALPKASGADRHSRLIRQHVSTVECPSFIKFAIVFRSFVIRLSDIVVG